MKSLLYRISILEICFLCLMTVKVNSQNLSGIWRGYFITESGDQYKYEVQVLQDHSSHISGVTYSYLDTRFYGKALLSGSFASSSKVAVIQETKTVELKMSGGSNACIMKCMFTYAISGKEEFLEGTFTSYYEKSDPSFGIMKGGNCGGGKVYLRKVITSDFYVEPFLNKSTSTPQYDSARKKPGTSSTGNKTRLPLKKPVTSYHTPSLKNPQKQGTVKNQSINPKTALHDPGTRIRMKKDSIEKRIHDTVAVIKPVDKTSVTVPVITRSRQNELVQTITVNNREINIRLYDNGEIDDDTVSVYMDGKPLTMNRRLSTVPISITLHLDDDNTEHTLIMYAENMGRIPPNTSLMIIQDGDKRYQVNIISTEQKNAMVRFRYQKKP